MNRVVYTFALVWATLVAIIPCIFGFIMLGRFETVSAPNVTVGQVFAAMAYRNFAFGFVLFFAVVIQVLYRNNARALALLLAARGLTELADGVSGVFAAGPAPFVGAAGDLCFAALLFFRAPAPEGHAHCASAHPSR